MDYEDPGTPKPGAAVLANMITPEGRKLPLLITENFGRGRTAIMATGGSWRWQMSSPLGDTAHDLFWQQLLRWVVSDTPGHVAASVPAQMLLDNGAVTLTADVRDPQYNPAPDAKVEAHILGPSGVSALVEMTPVPDNPGQFQAAWSAPKTGAYLTEVTAQRDTAKELGRDVLTFQRMDGVAENFHTEQNRDLLEHLATQTGGQYWKPADLGKLAAAIPFSEAGVTMRETKDLWDLPLVFLVLCCCASPSGGCAAVGDRLKWRAHSYERVEIISTLFQEPCSNGTSEPCKVTLFGTSSGRLWSDRVYPLSYTLWRRSRAFQHCSASIRIRLRTSCR